MRTILSNKAKVDILLNMRKIFLRLFCSQDVVPNKTTRYPITQKGYALLHINVGMQQCYQK